MLCWIVFIATKLTAFCSSFFRTVPLIQEKKVKHIFNEETGTLTACIADPGELDVAPKTQMVLHYFNFVPFASCNEHLCH